MSENATGGVQGGVSAPGVGGGSSAPGASGGSTGAGATAGLGALAGRLPNGGSSVFGQLVSGMPLPEHDHLSPSTGAVIDYARLVVSATPPPAPASPSDAFWLNPTEVA